jgi:hypothetical protein
VTKSRRVKWARYTVHVGEMRNAFRILVGKPEGKRPRGISRRTLEDNIKMDLMY